jgi:hypothetical protein
MDELRALVAKWRAEDHESREKQADTNARLQRGETITFETTTNGKWLHEKRADELEAALAAEATASVKGDASHSQHIYIGDQLPTEKCCSCGWLCRGSRDTCKAEWDKHVALSARSERCREASRRVGTTEQRLMLGS